MITTKCIVCGKEFKQYPCQHKKYCSYECSRKARCTLKEIHCANCNKLFKPINKRYKYCCEQCAHDDYTRKDIRRHIVTCEYCKKEFETTFTGNSKYCSRDCMFKDYSKKRKGIKKGSLEKQFGEEKARLIREKHRQYKPKRESIEKGRLKLIGSKRNQKTKEKLRNIQLSKEHQEKILQTKRKNGTFTSSSPEKRIEKRLLILFPDLKCQYKSEEYPFLCDFYIPSQNLYIEFQGHWTHGKHPFNSLPEDNLKVKEWMSKNTPFYNSAIHTWTIRDPNKRKVAKENNLNWLEFFSEKDLYDYFKIPDES